MTKTITPSELSNINYRLQRISQLENDAFIMKSEYQMYFKQLCDQYQVSAQSTVDGNGNLIEPPKQDEPKQETSDQATAEASAEPVVEGKQE